ncbi:unnamed protein product [Closterium sp. NIES-53]
MTELESRWPGGAESEGAGSWGADPGGAELGGSELGGAEPEGVEPSGCESGGAESRGAASSKGPTGALPRLSPRPEPLSPQQLREWLVRRAHLWSRACGVGATGDTGAGGAGVTAGAGGTGGTAAAGPRGARTGPYSSQWEAAMDAEMASWKSTGTYLQTPPTTSSPLMVPPPPHLPSPSSAAQGVPLQVVFCTWLLLHAIRGWCTLCHLSLLYLVPCSPPAFKARYIARGFSQRQEVDYFQTFSPTPKMTTLRVLLHVAAQRDYKLHSLDFSTAFLQGSLHEEIWLRRPPGFTGLFPAGTQWSLRRPVYGLRQAPREWHNTLRTTLAALGFAPSIADPLLFLRTDTSLPPFYVLVYVDDLVFAIGDTKALTLVKSELQKRHTCTDLGELRSYLVLQIIRDRAWRTIIGPLTPPRTGMPEILLHFGFQFSSPQPTPLSTSHSLSAPPSDKSVEPSGPYPELVGCFMYLMTCTRPDLAYPLSLPAHYVAPGWHPKQRGQLRLVYVATRANSADIFTEALPPGDHQHFSSCLAVLDWSRDHLFSPTLPMGQVDVGVKSMLIREEQAEKVQPTLEKPAKKAPAGQLPAGERAAVNPTKKQSATRQSSEEPNTREKSAGKPAKVQQDDKGSEAGDDGGDAKDSTESDVMEYDDAKEDEDFPELVPDMHTDPEHHWDISTMTLKEALASWKGKAVKAAMEEEIRSLVGMGTWELVERSPGVNIMKNRWVLTMKYHIDDTVEHEKARLVVKGFTQVYGADYDKTYVPVSCYVTPRIFLNIVAVLDLNLMQLDMKNAFL